MVDTKRKTAHSKLPVSPGMYRSLYKRDYRWCEEYEPPNEEDVQKLQIADSQLKAKEFAIPREERAMTYSDSVVRERRELIPALSIKASSCADGAGGRKPEGSTSGPKALQQRKHFTSALPVAESCLPKYYPATELAATQAEKSGRLRALAEPENELSYCQHLPAAAQTAGTAGMLLCRQKLAPGWATYRQFTLEMCRARQRDAQQNRSMIMDSSVLMEGQWMEAVVDVLCRNRWVSEYKDNYSIFLRRLNRSSQTPSAELCSGLSSEKGIAMDTAQ
ncbi:hypothetical protein GRJ2_001263400 [Grus japonensis]|uniref:Uncharacterized protein n=1 Tax=Grus japonensis TaxID=30415 RepID=A0ABC9WRS4_GRUJA